MKQTEFPDYPDLPDFLDRAKGGGPKTWRKVALEKREDGSQVRGAQQKDKSDREL